MQKHKSSYLSMNHRIFYQYQNLILNMDNQSNAQNPQKQPIRVKTFQCFTKFQEARPAHRSNLVNKQLGYDALIQLPGETNPIKIKNCICSARPNSQLFKRFSRSLIKNIKNDVDQLLFFTSLNPISRIETSIGLPTNPGIFLILGLTYLDEKYKQAYQKCDIEFSFLEFREGQMFDLLCYTGQPITPQRECMQDRFANFRQHWVRATTFNQFIKLFKIALFNNRERDFKSQSSSYQCHSTFIMKIRNKLYGEEGELIRCQETTLIDFQANCMKQTTAGNKQKSGGKTILDYILIEMHNANPSNKQIHYHMVEENHLLLMVKNFLVRNKDKPSNSSNKHKAEDHCVGGQITIIDSISADIDSFTPSYAYLNHLNSMIGDSWEVQVAPKIKQEKTFNHAHVETQLSCVTEGVSMNTYSSLRHFHQFKQQLISEVKRCKNIMRELRKAINSAMKEKVQLTFLKNQLIAHQLKLIGSCIKSDHFKDFYNAKSYIQLEREVNIKTQSIKQQIKKKIRLIDEAQKRFLYLKKRECDYFDKFNLSRESKKNTCLEYIFQNSFNWTNMNPPKENWNISKTYDSKFKRISYIMGEDKQLEQLKFLVNYLSEYMYSLWDNYILYDQRTVANSLQFSEQLVGEEALLAEMIAKFINDLEGIKETEILYEQDNNVHNSNEVGLFRSMNFLGLIGPKKVVKGCEIGKRLMIANNQQKIKKRSSMGKIECGKLPVIAPKPTPIVIEGNLKISDLLANPHISQDKEN